MAIPPWAMEALRRGVGGVLDKVPPDTIDQLKKRAGDLISELPQTAARSVDAVMRGAQAGKQSVQRWTRRHVSLVTPVVNASGCLSPASITGVPLGNEAIEVMTEAALAGYSTGPVASQRLARRLAKCSGSAEHSILIASSVDAACLAVAASLGQTPTYFHRSQSQRLPGGTPIPNAFATAASTIREVGSADRVDAADGQSIETRAVVVAVDNGDAAGPWFKPMATSVDQAWTRVVFLPAAGWIEPSADSTSSPIEPKLPAVLATLATNIDLVITPGDGVLGGPRCGLIIGDNRLIAAIARTAVWPSTKATVGHEAAMVVTLESWTAGELGEIPVQAMLQTGEDNLRSRAERLATRISAEPKIRSCQITAEPASLTPSSKWSLPSRQLRLVHRDLEAAQWAEQLSGEVPAILVGVQDDAIIIDLRWIQPSDDIGLIGTLVGAPLDE